MKYYVKLYKGKKDLQIELTLMNLDCLLKMIRMGAIFFTNSNSGNFEYYNLSSYDRMTIEDDLHNMIYENLMYGDIEGRTTNE